MKKRTTKKSGGRRHAIAKQKHRHIVHTVTGTIDVTYRGVGYVRAENFSLDIEIQPAFLGTALHGDTVEISLHPRIANRRQTGEVVRVIERAKTIFAGVLRKTTNVDGQVSCFLVPDSGRVRRDIFIPRPNVGNAHDGQKVLVELIEWISPERAPVGKVVKILGKPGEHEAELESIVAEQGFVFDFPADVEKEARTIQKTFAETLAKEVGNRRDFRTVATMTIDPADAKDFDDALSIQALPDGTFEIGVHIADVSFYLSPGGALDFEAAERATSIYLVDRTIPMLPMALSADICSLRPDEDRLTYSAVFRMDRNGKVLERWFGRTVIRSHKRFTYEEAQRVLDTKRGPFAEELSLLADIARKLRTHRTASGGILFETDEVKVILNERYEPTKIFIKEGLFTHNLIEEFMLLANTEVATYLSSGKHHLEKVIFRVHDEPNPEKISQLAIFVKSLGHTLRHKNGKVTSRDLNKLLTDVRGTPEEGLIQVTAIRSMAKAVYSTKNVGHFGLAFPFYTHFTSPIRRYPDVLVHRLLSARLSGIRPAKELSDYLEEFALHSSEMEQRAAKAERESVKFKQAQYMLARTGHTYTGVISGLSEWAMFVEDTTTKSEGMIRLATMDDDYYIFDEKNYTLIGENTRKKYRLGDTVRFRVVGANTERRTIDYALVD